MSGAKTVAGTILVLLAIVLWNVYREHGSAGVRMWFGAKFLNRTYTPPPRIGRRRRAA